MTNAVESKTLADLIKSRHSIRKYQRGVTIPDAELNEMLELATWAPSSWNLQHWRFLVVKEQANKEKLVPIAYGQEQVADASVVIVVLGDKEANLEAPEVFAKAPDNVREAMLGQINGAYASIPNIGFGEAILNPSLAAMQLMLIARSKGYDTVPMGGFDRAKLAAALHIPDRYWPVMLLPIGKAEGDCRLTERFPLDKVVIHESFEA